MRYFLLNLNIIIVAPVVAYMLVIQVLFDAFTLGTIAASPFVNAFGNPFCTTDVNVADTNSDQSDRLFLSKSCSVSCSMLCTIIFDDHAVHWLSNPLATVVTGLPPEFVLANHAAALERSLQNPRAPPVKV